MTKIEQGNNEQGYETVKADERGTLMRDWNIEHKGSGQRGSLYPGAGEYVPTKVIAGRSRA